VLMIRLARRGARKQPHYRIVVIEKERARNGRPVEVVGTYNPRTNPASVELKRDRVEYWVSKGAQMSDRVNKLFSKPAPAAAVSAPLNAPARPPLLPDHCSLATEGFVANASNFTVRI
jgi:small subunit ribosomal protein S16